MHQIHIQTEKVLDTSLNETMVSITKIYALDSYSNKKTIRSNTNIKQETIRSNTNRDELRTTAAWWSTSSVVGPWRRGAQDQQEEVRRRSVWSGKAATYNGEKRGGRSSRPAPGGRSSSVVGRSEELRQSCSIGRAMVGAREDHAVGERRERAGGGGI
jgi:hypothetical protein